MRIHVPATEKERNDYLSFSPKLDLKPEWLDQIFTYGVQKYKIVGLRPHWNCKFPVLAARQPANRIYVFASHFINLCMIGNIPHPFYHPLWPRHTYD